MAVSATRTLSPTRLIPSYGIETIQEYLGITRSYIVELTNAGILKNAVNADGDIVKGKYELQATVKAYIQFLQSRDKRVQPVGDKELEKIKIRKGELDIENKIVEIARAQGTLLRLEDVNAEVIDMLLALRSKLLGFGPHVARLVTGKEEYDEVARILNNEMEKALIDLKPLDFDKVRARDRIWMKKSQGLFPATDDEMSEETTEDGTITGESTTTTATGDEANTAEPQGT